MNFNVIKKHDNKESNYRLLDQGVKLTTRTHYPYVVPDGDGYTAAGGVSPDFVERDTEEVNKTLMRVRGARKQRAAKANVPRESIKVIPLTTPVKMVEAVAQFEEITLDEARLKLAVVSLEEKIKEVMSVVNLQKAFESKRTK